jgi:hypothetical protein
MLKLDNFIIDNIFQKIINYIQKSPFVIAYYLWGLTIACLWAKSIFYKQYFEIFVGLVLILNQNELTQHIKTKRMLANPIRHSPGSYIFRTFLLFIFGGMIPLIIFSVDGYKIDAIINILWLSAIYTSCCSLPPPKEVKQPFDKMVLT